MYDSASGAAALALVVAGPLAGIVVSLVLVWRILKSAPVIRLGRTIMMHGGYKGRGEDGEWAVRVDGHELVLTPAGQKERRIAVGEIAEADVDGEYLLLRVRGEDEDLFIRPFGPKYPDRDIRIAAVKGLAEALRQEEG